MLDSFYPNAKFYKNEYLSPPLLKDRNQNGGGNIVYIKEGIKEKG